MFPLILFELQAKILLSSKNKFNETISFAFPFPHLQSSPLVRTVEKENEIYWSKHLL